MIDLVAAWRRGLPSGLPQLSRYSLASVLALAFDVGSYLMLTRAGMQPTLAGIIGYGLGLSLHYWLSVRFVFATAAINKVRRRLFAEFALSGLAGMVVTAVVIAIASNAIGLAALPAKMLATVASFLAVFELRRSVVFAPAVASTFPVHAGRPR